MCNTQEGAAEACAVPRDRTFANSLNLFFDLSQRMEPAYLRDPLLPVCRQICPTWTPDSASYVDTTCLWSCSNVLSQWGATQDGQQQLLSMIAQANASNTRM
jgi:hypothetical protein